MNEYFYSRNETPATHHFRGKNLDTDVDDQNSVNNENQLSVMSDENIRFESMKKEISVPIQKPTSSLFSSMSKQLITPSPSQFNIKDYAQKKLEFDDEVNLKSREIAQKKQEVKDRTKLNVYGLEELKSYTPLERNSQTTKQRHKQFLEQNSAKDLSDNLNIESIGDENESQFVMKKAKSK